MVNLQYNDEYIYYYILEKGCIEKEVYFKQILKIVIHCINLNRFIKQDIY